MRNWDSFQKVAKKMEEAGVLFFYDLYSVIADGDILWYYES